MILLFIMATFTPTSAELLFVYKLAVCYDENGLRWEPSQRRLPHSSSDSMNVHGETASRETVNQIQAANSSGALPPVAYSYPPIGSINNNSISLVRVHCPKNWRKCGLVLISTIRVPLLTRKPVPVMTIYHVSVDFPLVPSQSCQYALQYNLYHKLTINTAVTFGDDIHFKKMTATLPSELNRYHREIDK